MFVGDGAERQNLMAFAERERLSNVRFVPMQPKNKIAAFWALSHVALVQLKDDPLFGTVIPSKIFEAMAMQLPILLVAPKGEASAIIEENQNGIHVEAGQPQLLADTVVKLYDDSQGERKWEETYFITGNIVKEVSSDDNEEVDAEIYLSSDYISELGLQELCSSIKKAKTNGEFGAELKMSKASFLWKYKGMMKYKDCL